MIFTSTTSFSDLLKDSHCSFIPDLFPCLNESLFKIGLLPHSCYSVTTCFLSLDRFPKSQSFRFGLLYGALRHSQVALPFTTVIAIGLNGVNKLFLRLFDKRQLVWVVCWLWWSPQLVRGVGRIWYVTGMWAWLPLPLPWAARLWWWERYWGLIAWAPPPQTLSTVSTWSSKQTEPGVTGLLISEACVWGFSALHACLFSEWMVKQNRKDCGKAHDLRLRPCKIVTDYVYGVIYVVIRHLPFAPLQPDEKVCGSLRIFCEDTW